MPVASKAAWFLDNWGLLRPLDGPQYGDTAVGAESNLLTALVDTTELAVGAESNLLTALVESADLSAAGEGYLLVAEDNIADHAAAVEGDLLTAAFFDTTEQAAAAESESYPTSALSGFDYAVGVETQTWTAQISTSETGVGVDVFRPYPAVEIFSNEPGVAVEAQIFPVVALVGTEAATGGEATSQTASRASSEAVSALEAFVLAVALQAIDVGSGAEGEVSGRLSDDLAASAELEALTVVRTSSDFGVGLDQHTLSVGRTSTDLGSALDAEALHQFYMDAEIAMAGETFVITASLLSGELAVATDAQVSAADLLASDAASGTDTTAVAAGIHSDDFASGSEIEGIGIFSTDWAITWEFESLVARLVSEDFAWAEDAVSRLEKIILGGEGLQPIVDHPELVDTQGRAVLVAAGYMHSVEQLQPALVSAQAMEWVSGASMVPSRTMEDTTRS